MNNLSFSINDNGILIEYKIKKILAPSNSEYQYVIYTDNKDNTFASRYEIVDNKITLKPIEHDYEWQYIDKQLEGDK